MIGLTSLDKRISKLDEDDLGLHTRSSTRRRRREFGIVYLTQTTVESTSCVKRGSLMIRRSRCRQGYTFYSTKWVYLVPRDLDFQE